MKVTLISTVFNCVDRVAPFLASLQGQTRLPDEVVIVDGGSSDGTAEAFGADPRVTVIEAPGANISTGRNIALANATHEAIAATDADCELDPGWLAAIVAPLEDGADVAAGFYQPVAEDFFQRCVAALNLPMDASEVDPARFMPSARSVAFRREAIEASDRPSRSTSATPVAMRSQGCTPSATPCGSPSMAGSSPRSSPDGPGPSCSRQPAR